MSDKNMPVQSKALDLRAYLSTDAVKGPLSQAVPEWLSADRLLRIVFTSVMKNPKLLDCTRESILQSVMQCAQLGLEPILGRAYLVPYNNTKNNTMECQFQPGYQGLVDLARRSGKVNDVYAKVVYEKDHFEIEYGTERRLVHRPVLTGDRGEPIGAYAVWEHSNGVRSFEFMPIADIYERRDRSQSWKTALKYKRTDSVWHEWPAEMIAKTVIKHSSKTQPASIEFMQAVELDNAAESGRNQIGMFPDSPPMLEAPAPTESVMERLKGKPAPAPEMTDEEKAAIVAGEAAEEGMP